jgi:hypothetical protein
MSADHANSHVVVARNAETDVRQRQVIVSIDDGPKTTLIFGESASWELPPGPHVLKANNTLIWKKVAFESNPGDRIEFVVSNEATRFTLGFLALMGVAPLYLTIERRV